MVPILFRSNEQYFNLNFIQQWLVYKQNDNTTENSKTHLT